MTDDIAKQVKDRIEAEAADGIDDAGTEITGAFVRKCLRKNELGDSELYAAVHRNRFVYSKAAGEWFEWTGHFWVRDDMGRSLAAVEDIVSRYLDEYRSISDRIADLAGKGDDVKDEITKLRGIQKDILIRVKQLRAEKRRNACLKFAHTNERPLAVSGHEFDQKPMLFACANGVIDLETGRLRPGCPGDYLSMASPVEWRGIDFPAPVWERSLMEICNDNEDLYHYIQRILGYGMTGLVSEKAFPVLYGKTGWNGRSLIIETVSHVMGDMAGSIPSEMLLSQKFGKSASGPTPDIMSLKGKRMAFASEVDDNQRFSSAKVKWLTGRDELIGRNPHDKYSIRFQPTHKLFLETNVFPSSPAYDQAFWERMHVVPFDISFVNRDPRELWERRAILDLDRKVLHEASGILAWLVRGCLLWQRRGLDPPPVVRNATEQQRRDDDMISDFIEECCIREPGAREKSSNLYHRFTEWYHDNHGKKEPSGTWFGKQLGARPDLTKGKSEGCIVYHGISLAD